MTYVVKIILSCVLRVIKFALFSSSQMSKNIIALHEFLLSN